MYYICLATFETFSFSFISFKLILSIPNVDEMCMRIGNIHGIGWTIWDFRWQFNYHWEENMLDKAAR